MLGQGSRDEQSIAAIAKQLLVEIQRTRGYGHLSNLNEVALWIAHVAPHLRCMDFGLSDELRSPRRPELVAFMSVTRRFMKLLRTFGSWTFSSRRRGPHDGPRRSHESGRRLRQRALSGHHNLRDERPAHGVNVSIREDWANVHLKACQLAMDQRTSKMP